MLHVRSAIADVLDTQTLAELRNLPAEAHKRRPGRSKPARPRPFMRTGADSRRRSGAGSRA
jgi:hypothetical protein